MSEQKIVDCTLRDGGLVNNFFFTDEFVKDLYEMNIAAGVDYMEFGYKADKDMFDEKEFGKWKFCKEEDIRAIVGNNPTSMKISVMADIGRCNIKRDLLPKKDSVIDMVRVATYAETIQEAVETANYCHSLGYETTVNVMAVSKTDSNILEHALSCLAGCDADAIYLVDSFGAFYPSDIRELTKKYISYCNGAKSKKVGIHAHNNQQLAFANTLEALSNGAQYLDVTVSSLGRGAGNCPTELLLSALKENGKYDIEPVLSFIEKHILTLRREGLKWGYDIPYLLTGNTNKHPSAAIQFIKEGNTDYTTFHQGLKRA